MNDRKWLEDERYLTVLRATHTVAFEYDPKTRIQYTSPFIHEYVAGNYDGRLLSEVMLQDGVIHPDDIELSLQFRNNVESGKTGKMTLRLKTPKGDYRWFEMILCSCNMEGESLYVGVLRDVDSEVRQSELLRYRAEYDSISGIYNKHTFFDVTKKLLEEEPEQLHFLIRFDINRFKIINELYTIVEGDQVLHYVGTILRRLTYPYETYARLGNDVFAMCLTRTEEEVLNLLEELEKSVEAYPLAFRFVLSIGILRIDHYHGEPINLLCDWAAMAQRQVKGNFVKRYNFYDKSMTDTLNREHYITVCMEGALKNRQFLIYLQPKYDMCSNEIIGAEVLARWKHPVDGMIPPGDFIPLFERNGFILRLDEYIWEQACKALRKWLDMGLNPKPVSVNVSRIHLHDPKFCDKVLELIERYQLPPSLLELEITESVYIECAQTLYDIMEKLQEKGFKFSMDDFGSGYSSLNILKDIPVDIVKIDLNFLREARRGAAVGKGILKGTIQLVQSMKLPIIAEGVETKEQAEFLISVGCTHAQGYYYAQPMPVDEYEQLLIAERKKKLSDDQNKTK